MKPLLFSMKIRQSIKLIPKSERCERKLAAQSKLFNNRNHEISVTHSVCRFATRKSTNFVGNPSTTLTQLIL